MKTSRALGCSSIRVTQDIDVHIHDDAYDGFYEVTV